MRKLILMTLCTVLALSVHAQKNGKSADELADKRAAKLKTELGLSDEQHKSVRAAVLEKISSASAVRERYKDSANKKGMGAELKQVNLRFRTTMDAILTADQRAKYKASEDEEDDDDRSDQKSDSKAEKAKNKSDKEQASTDKKQASIDKKQAKVDRQQAKVKRKEAKVKEREERLKAKEEKLKEKKEKLEEKDEKLEKKEKKLEQKEEELKK